MYYCFSVFIHTRFIFSKQRPPSHTRTPQQSPPPHSTYKIFAALRSVSPSCFPACLLSAWSASQQLYHYLITVTRICVCACVCICVCVRLCVPWLNGCALRPAGLEQNQENILYDDMVSRRGLG